MLNDHFYECYNPEVRSALQHHTSLLSMYHSQFGKPEYWQDVVDAQIRILQLHRSDMKNPGLIDRCNRTIDYWQRRRTDSGAIWQSIVKVPVDRSH